MSLGRKDTVAARISQYLEVAPPSDAAQASDVLLGKQFITTGYAFQTGTMPDNGDLGTITPTITDQSIPEGYTLGGTVAGDADLLPANIIDGVTIFGVLGTGGIPEGTAQPSEVLFGETFMNAGGPQTGTMPNNGSLGTITPTTTNQSIPAGFTTGGTVAGSPNLLPGNIRISTNIFGVIGTLDPGTQTGGDAVSANVLTGKTFTNDSGQQIGAMANRAGDTAALSSIVAGTTLKLLASDGYRDGVDDFVTITDADFAASNIKKDINVLGVIGTYEGSGGVIVGQTEETIQFGETIAINDPIYVAIDNSKIADPSALPAGGAQSVAFSPDETYLAIAHSITPFVTIYKRSGDTFTKLANPASLPTGNARGVMFSPDGIYLAVVHNTSPFLTIYKRSVDTFTKLSDPATLPTGTGNGVSFSSDGVYLSVTHAITPFVTIYKRSGDTFTKLTNPSTLPTGTGQSITFSPDTTYLVVGHTTSPGITIYKRSGDTFTKLVDPASLPASTGFGVAFSPDMVFLAVSTAVSPFIHIYSRSGDIFTMLTQVPAQTNTPFSVYFSPDSQTLGIALGASPYLTLYSHVLNSFFVIDPPPTMPTGQGNGITFSSTGSYFAVAHFTTPFVTIYKRNPTVIKATGGNWKAGARAGFAKEAGVTGESKKVIITHR